MKARIELAKVLPKAMQAPCPVSEYFNGSGLDQRMLGLVKMRTSQLNGCAYCIDMHSKDARAAGETEPRLYLLDAWRETPLYSKRERAALVEPPCRIFCRLDGKRAYLLYVMRSEQLLRVRRLASRDKRTSK